MRPPIPELDGEGALEVACDMLAERGWPIAGRLPDDPAAQLDALWPLCCDRTLHELACRYVEPLLAYWEGDDRPRRAIETMRAWLAGAAEREAVTEAHRELREAQRQAASLASYAAGAIADALEFALDRDACECARRGSYSARAVIALATAPDRRPRRSRVFRWLVADEPAAYDYEADRQRQRRAQREQVRITMAHMLEVGPPGA